MKSIQIVKIIIMIFRNLTAYHKHLEESPKVKLTYSLEEEISKKIALAA